MPVAEITTVPRGIQDPTKANVKPSTVVDKKTTFAPVRQRVRTGASKR